MSPLIAVNNLRIKYVFRMFFELEFTYNFFQINVKVSSCSGAALVFAPSFAAARL
jgi:hypothetical protein